MNLPTDQNASGRTLGREEIDLLSSVIESGVLISTKGSLVRELERRFAERLGSRHAFACSSGTAAIHAAVAAIDPEPGDEIVTSPITDMGAITPILFQGAIPVFADVSPEAFNLTAETIEPVLSARTRAIIVTHLFGCPCDMEPILRLARKRGVAVVEDSAQAYLAEVNGSAVGTLGEIGCFSLQQGKHMTTGEGGLVVTDDPQLARRVRLFINKAWDYEGPNPDHLFLALNYRMTELQGAVGLAQLGKLDASVENRIELAARLTSRVGGVASLAPQSTPAEARHAYWRYALRVDGEIVPGGPRALAAVLLEHGIASAPNYVGKPAFQCRIFSDRRTFGKSRYPFTLARPEALDYSPERYPGTFAGLRDMLVLPWNERYSTVHVDAIASCLEQCVDRLRGRPNGR